jgi:hypothetical protein
VAGRALAANSMYKYWLEGSAMATSGQGRTSAGIRRRELIAFLCSAVALPKSVPAETKRKHPLIAFLATASQTAATHYIHPFLEGMRERGYIEGRDFDMGLSICR